MKLDSMVNAHLSICFKRHLLFRLVVVYVRQQGTMEEFKTGSAAVFVVFGV